MTPTITKPAATKLAFKNPASMIVAGIMSGTSADGVDVAVTRISPGDDRPRLTLLAHEGYPFAPALRRAILFAMNAQSISTAELARLNWRLGIAYAEAVTATLQKHPRKLDLIGCHGQTMYHQAEKRLYAGRRFACTWQLGEAAVLASETRTPVVSNFRPADMLAGGEGAPLVPLLDYTLFAHKHRARVLQNIGGIANFTAIPASAGPEALIAFDSGPGNMILDALAQQLFHRTFDLNGKIAARGKVLSPVLNVLLRHLFFRKSPPRTAGREQFGREYTHRLLLLCRQHSPHPEDAMATACALTAYSIAAAFERFAYPAMERAPIDYIVSGGGAKNNTLMTMLADRLNPLGCKLLPSEAFGLPAEAKEAAAFALLAWHTWHHRPANLPAATGASHPAILGQVTYV